jgi:hypothetical protein
MAHPATSRSGAGAKRWRSARTCYDHLAGRLGVTLADALVDRGHVVLSEDGGVVTTAGEVFLDGFGAPLGGTGRGRRAFCRPCLDWSERRAHLAGALGAGLAARCFELGWISRIRDTRAVLVTQAGKRGFSDTFGLVVSGPSPRRIKVTRLRGLRTFPPSPRNGEDDVLEPI